MSALYIHIPFCQKKCFYCSFVVAIGQEHRMDPYLDCLQLEAESFKESIIKTVYLGGGTPSFLNLEQLKKFFMMIHNKFKVSFDCEWTIEANPEGLDLQKARLLYDLGVNRVSLGIQSLNDHYLRYLGRNHDAKSAVRAFGFLRQAGFKNINLDLMYSFPGQTDSQIRQDVYALTSLGSEHLSLYSLTIEENSRFYTSKVKLSDDIDLARQYELVVDCIEQSGIHQYEVSNFARTGKESRHNLNYWQGGDYIGLGVSAHSHRQGMRSWNVSEMNVYMQKTQQGLSPIAGLEELTPRQRLIELIGFGLRMNSGVHVPRVCDLLGQHWDDDQERKIQQFVSEGLLYWQNEFLKATSKGRLVLDEIVVYLL